MTLANRIAEVAKARPRSEALVYWRYGIREALTFAELESQIRKAEHGFAKLGVHREVLEPGLGRRLGHEACTARGRHVASRRVRVAPPHHVTPRRP